jgi:hypothetical protein
MNEEIKNGVAVDPRLQEEKAQDHLHEKLYSGLPVTWVEKIDWKLPSERKQDGSSSCVKQASATAIETLLKNVISAGTYKLRSNFPQEGMWLQNCGDLDKNNGTVAELIAPSQNMNEEQMNNFELPKFFNVKITGYRFFNKLTIDEVAEAIQAYGNCILIFDICSNEWQVTPKYLGTKILAGHAICATDFGLKNGVKTLACRDSAGSSRVRYITEDFLNKRSRGAMYYTGAVITPVPNTWEAILDFFIRLLKGLK